MEGQYVAAGGSPWTLRASRPKRPRVESYSSSGEEKEAADDLRDLRVTEAQSVGEVGERLEEEDSITILEYAVPYSPALFSSSSEPGAGDSDGDSIQFLGLYPAEPSGEAGEEDEEEEEEEQGERGEALKGREEEEVGEGSVEKETGVEDDILSLYDLLGDESSHSVDSHVLSVPGDKSLADYLDVRKAYAFLNNTRARGTVGFQDFAIYILAGGVLKHRSPHYYHLLALGPAEIALWPQFLEAGGASKHLRLADGGSAWELLDVLSTVHPSPEEVFRSLPQAVKDHRAGLNPRSLLRVERLCPSPPPLLAFSGIPPLAIPLSAALVESYKEAWCWAGREETFRLLKNSCEVALKMAIHANLSIKPCVEVSAILHRMRMAGGLMPYMGLFQLPITPGEPLEAEKKRLLNPLFTPKGSLIYPPYFKALCTLNEALFPAQPPIPRPVNIFPQSICEFCGNAELPLKAMDSCRRCGEVFHMY